MKVAQLGNFGPAHSTENELRRALEFLGHDVTLYQENDPGAFVRLAGRVAEYDWALWTRTGWQPPVPDDEQYRMLLAAERAGVPTIGYHLDRWFGLGREHIVHEAPFFRASVVITADGGHGAEFAAAGVRHVWMPPAVSHLECQRGTSQPYFASDVAFVGSWQPGYHPEWQHRPQLVQFLQETYGPRVKFWPKRGQHAVRGDALRDLYASTKVVVGDSCLVGNAKRYWSDRVPETTGRGGFLLHPYVEGLQDHHESVVQWDAGDWDTLRMLIDHYLEWDEDRQLLSDRQMQETKRLHTYAVRMTAVSIMVTQL